jgi:hypothetical protein
MRPMLTVSVLVVMTAAMGAVQNETPAAKGVKKGDQIIVRGCLNGGALEATDLGNAGMSSELSGGVTFRLTGDKTLLKQLREEQNGRLIEVEGVLKSDLPKDSVASRKVGKMTVTIGTPSPNAMSETQRSLPVLEVKSFEGSRTTCGR